MAQGLPSCPSIAMLSSLELAALLSMDPDRCFAIIINIMQANLIG